MNKVIICIRDSSSKNANNLLDYLNKNLEVLVTRNNYCFDIIVVKKKEVEDYENKGITKFPTLMFNSEKHSGYKNIYKFLRTQQQPKPKARMDPVGEGFDYHDMLVHQITDMSDMQGEGPFAGEGFVGDSKDKLARMQAERNIISNGKPKIPTPADDFIAAYHNNQKKNGGNAGNNNENYHQQMPMQQSHIQDPDMRDFSRQPPQQNRMPHMGQGGPPTQNIKIAPGRLDEVDNVMSNYMDSQSEPLFD